MGALAMPAAAKQDPGHGQQAQTPPGQVQTPPGQAKKQDPAQPPAAAQTAPAPVPAPAPAPDKHAAKQQAKAQRQAAKQQAAATAQTAAGSSKQQAKAQHQAAKQQAKAQRQAAKQQAKATTTTAAATTGRSPKRIAATTPAATSSAAPAATTPAATPPVTSGGSLTAAKARHKARRHRAATSTRSAVVRAAIPVAAIAPVAVATAGPAATSTTKANKGGGSGYVPAPSNKHDDTPNVVFRTVRDAVQVVPAAIWILLGLLTLLASLFAVTSARQTRRAHRLAAERGELLGDVGVLQEAVLPIVPPRVGALALSVAHRPAGGPAAGGDLYDVVALDNDRTALIVGDVSGHGPAALGHATIVRFTLRAHLESGAGPREALAIAADSLASHFDEGFATAAIALHDPDSGTLTYATAAHEAPIVIGPGEHEPIVVASTPPLGIGGPSARRQTVIPFPEGSLATMLTDGALEARLRGELVGRARVEAWVREMGERPAAGDMAELIRERAAVSDDLAVCFATSTRGEDSGNWRIEELHRPKPGEAERFLEACGATEQQKRAAAEALRFSAEHAVLVVRFENDVVVAVDVTRNGSPKPVAA